MSISPEVQKAVDEIHREKDINAALKKASTVRDRQIADLQAKIDSAQSLSDDDRKALNDAVADAQDVNGDLETAVPANTEPAAANGVSAGGAPVQTGPGSTAGDAGEINGPSTADGGPGAPLMPTSSFDPSPGTAAPPSDGAQQLRAIETPGGFVIAGGGSTARAVGSMPDSPSSSVVVPLDPDAKAPQNNADVIKSGLGDSSQNALLGNDGQPVQHGPGIPKEPSEQAQEAAQKQQDLLAQEDEARRINPLNMAPEGTPVAGSANQKTPAPIMPEDKPAA